MTTRLAIELHRLEPDPDRPSPLVSRNVWVHGRRTSVRLEESMWIALKELCHRERVTLAELCTFAASRKRTGLSLTAALRVLIANYFRAAASEQGHLAAGHGRGAITGCLSLLPALGGDSPPVPAVRLAG